MGESRNKVLGSRKVDLKTAELSAAILDSEEYKEFLYYLGEIKKQPELYDRVCDYRRRNFELQNMDINDNMFDEVMHFQMENAGIRKDGLVNNFLRAELSVCRMLQDITRSISESVELDTDFLG